MFLWASSILGSLLLATVLLDVFLTVLYARSGAGVFTPRLSAGVWKAFCLAARMRPRSRDRILALGGPSLLVMIGAIWVTGILIGFALIIWPRLGTELVATQGDTPTDFATAVYVSGYYMTTVGNGDIRPTVGTIKIALVIDSIVGMSLITLMLTYFMQIYSALQRRSTFALKLHKGTAGTGDAAELIAGIGADGNFEGARGILMVIADELLGVYESYHFYETLIFFRFQQPLYSLPRAALLVMDIATLLRTAIDQEQYAYIVESVPSRQLWHGGMHSLSELSKVFVPPRGEPARGKPPSPEEEERWRRRYTIAVERFRAAGIQTPANEKEGADDYVRLRCDWDAIIAAFSQYLRFSWDDTDPAGCALE